jgi:PhoH-like ATPase
LPGDIEEKLSPYLAGIKDNLSILHKSGSKQELDKKSRDSFADGPYEDGSYFFAKGMVQIQAIGFLRGRSIVDTYFIIDETQNIEPDTIKSIVTRAGEGSKFIFLGDPTQIDNPNLTERYNGLVYLSEKMKGNPMCAQIALADSESVRSELARKAAQIL